MEGTSRYSPYTKLFVHSSRSVALSANGHIHVLDTTTGSILHSTTAPGDELRETVKKSGALLCADVDPSFTYLGVASSDKTVRVWDIRSLTVVSEREAPKKPTDIHFTKDAQKILVSDKFGDLHSFPLRTSEEQPGAPEASTSGKIKPIKANKRIIDGTLVLGHVSLLTTFQLSADEKYVITADRDEHIRVSWYPEAYTIERFCLGQSKFVSALHIPSWDPSLLVSGGGDPTLRIWNWMEGKVLCEIPVSENVMPFVKVIRKKPGRHDEGSDAEGGGEQGSEKLSSRKKRKAKKKKKNAGDHDEKEKNEDDRTQNDGGDENAMEVDENREAGETKTEGRKESTKPDQPPEPLLAVQKIVSFEHTSSKFVLFSAHGATVLFYCSFPSLSHSESSWLPPDVRSVDVGKPVLDFVYWSEIAEVWILVDGAWTADSSNGLEDAKPVRVVKLVNGELVASDVSAHQALFNCLNTSARVETTADEAKNVDLYSALISLPKNLEVDHNAMDEEPLSEIAPEKLGQLSNKELGRLKSKKAMLARAAALANQREESEAPVEERDAKRKRADDTEQPNPQEPTTL